MGVPIPLKGVRKINDRILQSTMNARGGYIYCEMLDTPGSRDRIYRVRTRKKQLRKVGK